MTHKTQLTLSDTQLAVIMNAVQLAIISLRLHQDVQEPNDFIRALAQGFAVCDSFEPETWKEIHTMLSVALEDVTDPDITPIPHVPDAERLNFD